MTLLRNPRAVVPPSQRIPNWRALPVEGAGPRRLNARNFDRCCNAIVFAFALLVAWLCASRGWGW